MEFHTTLVPPPKNLYPCLVTIAIGAGAGSRRASFAGSADGDDNALRRVISGSGRRKSSFGTSDQTREGANPAPKGEWYWRVQAGVDESSLVLLALSSPPNPVLTSPPGPLSHAMPSHAVEGTPQATDDKDKSNIGDKIKNFFRRGSTTTEGTGSSDAAPAPPATATATAEAPVVAPVTDSTAPGVGTTSTIAGAPAVAQSATTGAVDPILDQTPAGDQLPSTTTTGAESFATSTTAGATSAQANAGTANASAEQGFPGVINGQRLVAIVVPLHAIKKEIAVGGGKKNEGNWVAVTVTSAIAGKAGTLRFEFDKDWLGGKAEAELLHHNLTNAIEAANDLPPEVRFAGKPQGDAEYKENWQGNVRGKW